MQKSLIWILMTVLFVFLAGCDENENENEDGIIDPGEMPYNLVVNPANFETTNITGNAYFPMIPGTTLHYEGEDEDGAMVEVTDYFTTDTKDIMGVTCIVVENKEWIDGELIEETEDWYAQDLDGNVWYFGEYSQEIENGVVVSTAGSWEAGVDGALPGIIMFANPYIGIWYRQEYYEDEAEDVAQILSISESVIVPYGSYTDCLLTAEWNLLEPDVIEHKYYAAGIGMIRAVAVEGETGYENLVDITTNP